MKPFIKDFHFYKARFGGKHKEIKDMLRNYSSLIDRYESCTSDDIESNKTNEIMAHIQKKSEEISIAIDEMEEIQKEITQLSQLSMTERQVQVRLKNQLKDIQMEHSTLKKVLKH